MQEHHAERLTRDGIVYEFAYATEALRSGGTVLFCLITVDDPQAAMPTYYSKVWANPAKWVIPVFFNFQSKFIHDVDYRRQYRIESEGAMNEHPR